MTKGIVIVKIDGYEDEYELEIPLDVSVKEISAALMEALKLKERGINISGYYMRTENPTCFLKGNDVLNKYNIAFGSKIILI